MMDLSRIVVSDKRFTSGQINKQQVEELDEIDESTIKAGNDSTSGINTEYVLSSSTDVESELQDDERNNNSEIEDNNLDDYNLDDEELSKMKWIQKLPSYF